MKRLYLLADQSEIFYSILCATKEGEEGGKGSKSLAGNVSRNSKIGKNVGEGEGGEKE